MTKRRKECHNDPCRCVHYLVLECGDKSLACYSELTHTTRVTTLQLAVDCPECLDWLEADNG